MKKIISLIKACMTSDMGIFKINLRHRSKMSKILIIVFLCFALMTGIGSYVCAVLEQLKPFNMQYVCLSIFVLFISFMTLIEGIYKSGNLLYNCKDDQLLFSLPIDKKAILYNKEGNSAESKKYAQEIENDYPNTMFYNDVTKKIIYGN